MSEAPNQLSRDPVIPDKLYFRIGEVARLLDVETHTLRFWESEFPQLKVGKGGTGQRLYRRRDVETVFEIKHLLYEQGYTIPGARQFLQNRQRRKEPATANAAPPANASASATAAVVRGDEAETPPNLESIRAGLRDLSALLTETGPSERAGNRAPARDRTRPASEPLRRGLHLAQRPPAKRNPPHTSPGLFDPDSD